MAQSPLASTASSVQLLSGLDDPNVSFEKKMEALNAKDAKVTKREKEVAEKAKEYERKLKNIEAEEEKLGSINMREIQLEAAKTELAEKAALIKKKEKQAKDMETAAMEKERLAIELDQASTQRKQDLDQRQEALDIAEAKCAAATAAANELFRTSTARAEENAVLSASLKQRMEEADALERVLRRRESQVSEDEADIAKRKKALKDKEDEVEKLSQQLAQRQTSINGKEFAFAVEREKLNQRKTKLDDAEKQIQQNLLVAQTKKEESIRSQMECEAMRKEAQHRLDDANNTFHEASQKMAIAENARLENLRFSAELSHTNSEQSKLEIELRKREKKLASLQATLDATGLKLSEKENELAAMAADIAQREDKLRADMDALRQREHRMDETIAEHREQVDKLKASEQLLQRRLREVERREKELVDWMKEMEWREMMLGEKEESTANREPSTLGRSPGMIGGSGDQQLNKVFGKALVEVQLRRLKDQYISAQLRHAQNLVSVGETAQLQKGVGNQKVRIRPRCGVAPMYSNAADVDDDFQKSGEIEGLRSKVHQESLRFVRTVSKLRAFDSNEAADSKERLAQLNLFSEEERMVLSMATNLEYFFRSHESFYTNRMDGPLDEKDASHSAQELVAKLTEWWREVREHMRGCLAQLLSDRHRYLEQALDILSSKESLLQEAVVKCSSSSALALLPPVERCGSPQGLSSSVIDHIASSPILLKRGGAAVLKTRSVKKEQAAREAAALTASPSHAFHQDKLRGHVPSGGSVDLFVLVPTSSSQQGDEGGMGGRSTTTGAAPGASTSSALVPLESISSPAVRRPVTRGTSGSPLGSSQGPRPAFGTQDPSIEMCLIHTGRVSSGIRTEHPKTEFDVTKIPIAKGALKSPYEIATKFV